MTPDSERAVTASADVPAGYDVRADKRVRNRHEPLASDEAGPKL
jgi:hypothetical protein